MFLAVGEPAPWVTLASDTNPKFHFDTVAGRYVVLCFLYSSTKAVSQQVLRDITKHRGIFDDDFCCFFGISHDPEDHQRSRLQNQLPGIRFLWDFDHQASRLFKVINADGTYYPCSYILDPRLRVIAVVPFTAQPTPLSLTQADEQSAMQPENHVAQLMALLATLPKFAPSTAATVQAPILVAPRIFEPELCQALMAYYNHHGGKESGFMQERDGQTVASYDNTFKRRRDQEILDQDLRRQAMHRIHDRLAPEVQKAFQFRATRIERHIVACYDSTQGGFFRPHRDNTTKATAHRRFAVSLNLNTGEYEGGLLRFPEFGHQTYTAPAGGAVVFSCSLLHEATPVTAGYRYAYLPFLYDDAAAEIRQRNQQFLAVE